MQHYRTGTAVMLVSIFGSFAAACGSGGLGLPVGNGDAGNQPPVFSASPGIAVPAEALYTFHASATDADDDLLTFGLISAPAGMSMTPDGLVTWVPSDSQTGDHDIMLGVSDGSHTTTLNWTLTVTPFALPPTVTSDAPTLAGIGELYTYRIAATGSPSPAIAVTGLPSWLTFNGMDTISGTPGPNDVGTTGPISATAFNNVIPQAIQIWSITVAAAAAPVFVSVPVTQGPLGRFYEYRIVASGSPAPDLSVSGAPLWLTFDQSTSTLSGWAPPPGGKTGTISISASNSEGVATQEFWIDVVGEWALDVIAQTGINQPGNFCSVAVDSQGFVHTAYQYTGLDADGMDTGFLKYATNASGVWVSETLDNPAEVLDHGFWNAIALDAGGHVHIVSGATNATTYAFELRYITNVSGNWTGETIETLPSGGFYSNMATMAIDSQGHVHVAYKRGSVVRYATNASGMWELDNAAGAGGDGVWPSLALDANGKVHVAFYANAPGTQRLRIAVREGPGNWVRETIDEPNPDTSSWLPGFTPSLAIDSRGFAHIAHLDYNFGVLKYSTNASGTWVSTMLLDPSWSEGRTAIVVDAQDRIHITHVGFDNMDIRYVTNTTGHWTFSSVGPPQNGDFPAERSGLAMDTDGKLHVVWCSKLSPSFELRYAKRG